jgi:3-hydroxybutyrate dehydrogenase
MMRLHAVVTGGGGGIGLATAQSLCDAGHKVTIIGRDRAKLDRALATLKQASAVVCDVTDDDAVRSVFSTLEAVEILVNNAGGVESAPFERTSIGAWRAAIDLNLFGCVRTIQAVAPVMRKGGYGRIVNIASTAGLKGYPYVSPYASAKHALIGLTRSLALEYARTGVTINAICPGYTDTDLVANAVETISSKTGQSSSEAKAGLSAANPQGRLITPGEVAAAVIWLISEGGEGINGAAIPISGGEI